MKIRKRGKPLRGSIEKVRESDLGQGRRLVVHKLTPPQDPKIVSAMEAAKKWASTGFGGRAASAAYDIWKGAQGDKFVEVWAGQMLAKYGDREQAAEVYCASEGIPVGNWEAYWQLGLFLVGAGKTGRAVGFFEEAVHIEPRAIEAHLDLARCLQKLGRDEDAQRHLDEARLLDPDRFR